MNLNDYTLLELYQLREYVTQDLSLTMKGDDIVFRDSDYIYPRKELFNDINKRIEYLYNA